jgi:hypothetical protein
MLQQNFVFWQKLCCTIKAEGLERENNELTTMAVITLGIVSPYETQIRFVSM